MNSSKVAIIAHQVIEKALLIIGLSIILFFSFLTWISVYVFNLKFAGLITFFLVFIMIGIIMIFLSIKKRRFILCFREYVKRLSLEDSTGSIEELSRLMNSSANKVRANLKKMIAKNFFANAYIDEKEDKIIFVIQKEEINNSNVEYEVFVCNSCGGSNKIIKKKVCKCEFCGSWLSN